MSNTRSRSPPAAIPPVTNSTEFACTCQPTKGNPNWRCTPTRLGNRGTNICDFLDPIEVQHHRPYAVKPLPIPFLDIDCSGEVLAANTTYWLALAGSGYFPALTDSDDQQTNRSGWSIGNVAAISTAGSWSNLSSGTIPVEIWASKR